ncbi:hypothetical protein V2J09_021984 [Rumex salicifolius]
MFAAINTFNNSTLEVAYRGLSSTNKPSEYRSNAIERIGVYHQGRVCSVYHEDKGLILWIEMTLNRMFVVHAEMQSKEMPSEDQCMQVADNLESSLTLWHRRFGHLNH